MESENPVLLAEAKRELGIGAELMYGDKHRIAKYLAEKYELDVNNPKWWGNACIGGLRCYKCKNFRDNEFTQKCGYCGGH